jgi:hypothetical protein
MSSGFLYKEKSPRILIREKHLLLKCIGRAITYVLCTIGIKKITSFREYLIHCQSEGVSDKKDLVTLFY